MEGKSPPGDRNSGPINIPRIYFSNVTLVALFPRRQKKEKGKKKKKIPDILYDEPTEKMGPCRMNQHSILHGYYRPRRGLSDVVSTARKVSLSLSLFRAHEPDRQHNDWVVRFRVMFFLSLGARDRADDAAVAFAAFFGDQDRSFGPT